MILFIDYNMICFQLVIKQLKITNMYTYKRPCLDIDINNPTSYQHSYIKTKWRIRMNGTHIIIFGTGWNIVLYTTECLSIRTGFMTTDCMELVSEYAFQKCIYSSGVPKKNIYNLNECFDKWWSIAYIANPEDVIRPSENGYTEVSTFTMISKEFENCEIMYRDKRFVMRKRKLVHFVHLKTHDVFFGFVKL